MQKSLIALFGLFVVLSAVQLPSDGLLNLTRTDGGFYTVPVGVDFDPESGEATLSVNMLVSLFGNKLVLGNNCSGFNFDINGHGVAVTNKTDAVLLVNNRLPGNQTTANLTLDATYWSSTINAVYAANCVVYGNDTNFTAAGAAGVLGLGFGNGSLANYKTNQPVVAVSLSEDLSNGTLHFTKDDARIKDAESAQFTTANTFQVNAVTNVKLGTVAADTDNTTRILFDLNTDSIALPTTIYQAVISGINTTQNATAETTTNYTCDTASIYQPVCTVTGPLSGLPPLNIAVGETVLTIPPQAYVLNANQYNETAGGNVTLALKSVNSNATDPATHVYNTFNNSIVLGAPIFSYFYVVFTGDKDDTNASGTVQLYYPPGAGPTPNPDDQPGSSKWWIVLVILAIILLIVGIYWFVARRNKASKLQEEINNNLLRA